MIFCVVCGNTCVPMADYSQPVCPRCDASHEDAVIRMCLQRDDACPHCGLWPCRCRALSWAALELPKQRSKKASRVA